MHTLLIYMIEMNGQMYGYLLFKHRAMYQVCITRVYDLSKRSEKRDG